MGKITISCTIISQLLLAGLTPLSADTKSTDSSSDVSLEKKQVATESSKERIQRMKWFKEARFGMFVHWGLYSAAAGEWKGQHTRGGAEWIQKTMNIPKKDYAKTFIPKFKPEQGFATAWAKAAKGAGCKYLVFTSKHHDGFALHDSAVTTYDAKDAIQRDLVKEIVNACRVEGLKVGFYHSVIDWHHPDAYVGGGLPACKGDTNKGRDNKKYVDFLHTQVKELLTNYGKVDVLWWDYSSKKYQGESWRAKELLAMMHRLQPEIISNNRLFAKAKTGGTSSTGFDYSQGDFVTPEQRIPATGLPGINWETCMTMNGTWGYAAHDNHWKSTTTLIRNLINIASKGGNYLLNVGPKADGSIPEPSIKLLHAIGEWMKVNGESIYGTKSTIFPAAPWGRITMKAQKDGNTIIYLHVFKAPASGELLLAGLQNDVVSVAPLDSSQKRWKIKAEKTRSGVTVKLHGKPTNPHANVIKLIVKGSPQIVK